jgi:hypothetical protein
MALIGHSHVAVTAELSALTARPFCDLILGNKIVSRSNRMCSQT